MIVFRCAEKSDCEPDPKKRNPVHAFIAGAIVTLIDIVMLVMNVKLVVAK